MKRFSSSFGCETYLQASFSSIASETTCWFDCQAKIPMLSDCHMATVIYGKRPLMMKLAVAPNFGSSEKVRGGKKKHTHTQSPRVSKPIGFSLVKRSRTGQTLGQKPPGSSILCKRHTTPWHTAWLDLLAFTT